MSTHVVTVEVIQEVIPHPNADRLDLVKILGWQTVYAKDKLKAGEYVLFVPPDSVVPEPLAARWDVQTYLAKGQRVRAIKLRGEPSYGFVRKLDDEDLGIIDIPRRYSPVELEGMNLADVFGITKYMPPVKFTGGRGGQARVEHPAFHRYTDVENLRRYGNVFTDGEEVVITEKIHGTNSRVAIIDGDRMAGSRRVQRKDPKRVIVVRDTDRGLTKLFKRLRARLTGQDIETVRGTASTPPGTDTYWYPFEVPGVKEMLESHAEVYNQVVLYGEIYGPKIQPFDYGLSGEKLGYRAFDLMLDGKFLNQQDFEYTCIYYGIPIVPVLYEGPYSLETVIELSKGGSFVGGSHIREGVVVRPVQERNDPGVGRVLMKYVSDDFLVGEVPDLEAAA